MRLYDVSLPISKDLPVWPGDPSVSLKASSSILAGDVCNMTQIQMGTHTGTHLDAPYHFLENGGKMKSVPWETLWGACKVVELGSAGLIPKEDLLPFDFKNCPRVLLKTRNSKLWSSNSGVFDKDYVSLSLEGAQYLVEAGIVLVGIDYLSIEAFESKDHLVHKLLLGNRIVILEGLDLSAVEPGDYELICAPLKVQDCDGAPARVLLRKAC